MNKNLFILVLIGILLCAASCDRQSTTPLSSQEESHPSLAKIGVTHFVTDPLDWFVVDYPYGEYTFAQFNLDDPDVTVLSNGRILLKKRRVSCPISGDLVNPNIEAVMLVISSTLDAGFNGPAYGTISITATWEGLMGTFQGRFIGSFSNSLFSGKFSAAGTDGDFIGLRMAAIMSEPSGGEFTFEGEILSLK